MRVRVSFARGDEGVIFLGEKNNGKTQAMIALAMAMARYYIARDDVDATEAYRLASDLDSFRAEPGNLYRPDIFDDADLLDAQSEVGQVQGEVARR